jgi:hypothetical protein
MAPVGALIFAAASCGSPSTPLTSAQLQKRLLTSGSAPDGVKVVQMGPASGPDSTPSPEPLKCDDLVGIPFFVFGDPNAVPVGNANVTLQAGSGDSMWLGNEWLASYRDGVAQRAILDLKALVKRCLTVRTAASTDTLVTGPVDVPPATTFYSVLVGPKLGDESLTLREATRLDGAHGDVIRDAVIVRSGDTLIMADTTTGALQPQPVVTDSAIAAFKAFG